MSTENKYLAKTESLQKELEPVCRVITETVKAEAIYLFGSRAYGTPTDDSDYDLCVIIPEKSMRPVDAVKAIRRALLPLQTMSLDILVYRADTFFRRAQGATMERKIKRDGIPPIRKLLPQIIIPIIATRPSPTWVAAFCIFGGERRYLFGTLLPRQFWISWWTGSTGRS